MKLAPLAVAFAAAAVVKQSEPAPRALAALPLDLEVDLADVAGVRELANGHLLITDARAPAILVVDPATGIVRKLGREGQGPNEFGKPGGIYYDVDGTTSYVMDRSQPRVLVVDKTGALTGMRSIAQRGVRSAADGSDPMRVDAALHTYFVDRGAAFRARVGGGTVDSLPLIRFDVARQHGDTAARLFFTKPTVVSSKDRMTMTRTPVFSPADAWTVASDGNIAVIRAVPYRVDWIATTGASTIGTSIAYTPVPVTAADREALATGDAPRVTGGRPGSPASMGGGDSKPEFAKVKPPFDPEAIVVSPEGQVWVGRYMPASSKQVVYDLFDRRGARVDRIAFPARSRVVGFGPNAVFVAVLDDDDLPKLRKFRLTR